MKSDRARKQKPLNRKMVRRYKMMLGCKQCGYKKYHGALQLHHVDPAEKLNTKDRKAIQYNWSPTKIKRELRKCIVLCANCHAEHHWMEE